MGPVQGLGAVWLGESDGAALMDERDERDEVVVPVIEEELATGTRQVTTGAVRVEKRVEKRVRRVTAPALHEEVEIRRVPVNRVVDGGSEVAAEGEYGNRAGRGGGAGGDQAAGAEGGDPPDQEADEGSGGEGGRARVGSGRRCGGSSRFITVVM